MKIVIPERLADVTVDQWLKYKAVEAMPDFSEDVEDLALVTIFCNLTITEALQINAGDFEEIVDQVRGVLNQTPSFVQRFTMDGVEYGFIPNLDEMTQGELIGLDKYLEEIETYDLFLSIAYRPVKTTIPQAIRKMLKPRFRDLYNIEPYRADESLGAKMRGANLEVLLGAIVFFYRLGRDLLTSTLLYLESQEKSLTAEQSEALTRNGVGIRQLISSLEAAVSSTTMPQD